jgi:peroxiredoxin
VVLIVMRGFGATVCLHCSAQMLALAQKQQEFASRNARVYLVYPGDAATVPVFIKAVRALDPQFKPPFPLLLDVDLAAVRAFTIQGNLAKPTTLVLDGRGIVRWAYVGQEPADRPSIDLILTQLDRLAPGAGN